MNFNEAISAVIEITKRPDKSTEIATAINSVISLISMRASFARDLVEVSYPVDSTLYGDTISLNSPLITRFRKIKYIKPTAVRRYLKQIGSDQLFSPANVVQLDRFYIGGDSLTYTLKELTTALEIGYYQYPKTLTTIDSAHWMLDIMPYVVVDLAAARVFRSIGDDSSFKTHESMGQEAFLIHRRDHEDSIIPQAS